MSGEHFANGLVRKLWGTESQVFEAHLLRLDKEARQLRFGHAVSETFISDYAARLTDRHYLVFGYFEDGELRGVAELRTLSSTWGSDAEAAFSIERDWQNMGIGTELMGYVLRAARNRHIAHLHMVCMAENKTMQRIARRYKAELRFEYGTVIGDIVPDGPSVTSFADEAIADTRGFVMAVLDLQSAFLFGPSVGPRTKSNAGEHMRS